jgi:hypothetical protein
VSTHTLREEDVSVVAANTDDVLTLAIDSTLLSVYGQALRNMDISASQDLKDCDAGDVDAKARFVARLEDVGMLRNQLAARTGSGGASLTGSRNLLREAAFLAASSATRSLDEAVDDVGTHEPELVRGTLPSEPRASAEYFTANEEQQARLRGLSGTCFAAVGILVALQSPSMRDDDIA